MTEKEREEAARQMVAVAFTEERVSPNRSPGKVRSLPLPNAPDELFVGEEAIRELEEMAPQGGTSE